jgi:hypothetical protein
MSPIGTELPIPNVRSSIANSGKADKICSMRVLRILTLSGHGGDLIDHLVDRGQQRVWDREAKRLRGLEVDD